MLMLFGCNAQDDHSFRSCLLEAWVPLHRTSFPEPWICFINLVIQISELSTLLVSRIKCSICLKVSWGNSLWELMCETNTAEDYLQTMPSRPVSSWLIKRNHKHRDCSVSGMIKSCHRCVGSGAYLRHIPRHNSSCNFNTFIIYSLYLFQ